MVKRNNKYLLGVAVIAIVSFVYSGFKGSEEVSQREIDYAVYGEVQRSIKTGEQLEESIKKIDKLQKDYNDSYVLNLDKGSIYNSLGKRDEAKVELEKAFEKNKSLYKNANLLIIYAEVAHLSGDDKKAEETISKAKEIGIPQGQQKTVDKLLSEIK